MTQSIWTHLNQKMKLKYWRGFWSKSATEAAPVIVFDLREILFTSVRAEVSKHTRAKPLIVHVPQGPSIPQGNGKWVIRSSLEMQSRIRQPSTSKTCFAIKNTPENLNLIGG